MADVDVFVEMAAAVRSAATKRKGRGAPNLDQKIWRPHADRVVRAELGL